MMRAGRTAAGWLGGRALLFALALGALVVAQVSQDGASHLRARAVAWLPDAKLLGELERRRAETLREVDALRATRNERLATAHRQPPAELARWPGELDREIAQREGRGLDAVDLVLSVGETDVLVEHARNEATLYVLRWTRDELLHVMHGIASLKLPEPEAAAALAEARARHAATSASYWQAKRELQAFERAHPLAANVPLERFGLLDPDRRRILVLDSSRRQTEERVIASRIRETSARAGCSMRGIPS